MLSVFCSRDHSRAVRGIVINGSRDSKYDLHQLVYFRCTPESVTIIDPNPICIFILFLGDRRAIFFVFYYVSQQWHQSGSMSRYRFRSRSHVDVRADVLAMLPSSVASVQFINGMVSLFHKVLTIDRLWLSMIC